MPDIDRFHFAVSLCALHRHVTAFAPGIYLLALPAKLIDDGPNLAL